MSAPARLVLFAIVLAALFGAGALAGGAIGPEADEPRANAAAAHGAEEARGADERDRAHGAGEPSVVRGLSVAANGLRIVVGDPELRRGATETLRLRIVDAEGATVRDFGVEHERRMHLIVARRDLTGFQHLHPRQDTDGAWRVPVRLDRAGSYRVFADFVRDGKPFTLAADLRVDGAADLRALPPPAAVASAEGGPRVRLDAGRARPGREARLRFAIARDGRPVGPEPYLGARGHLVALREGDLAFLHVHPLADDGAVFAATFPTPGRYRLFLGFRHDGRVHTVAFTQEVR